MLSFPEKLDPYASGGGLLARGAHKHATLVYVLSLIWLYTCLVLAQHFMFTVGMMSFLLSYCLVVYMYLYIRCAQIIL